MSQAELNNFIKDHLYNELLWLLCSAVSWHKVKTQGTKKFPPHFILYTRDSAFLHARSLYEFFTYTKERKDKGKYLVIWKDFGLEQRLESELYGTWMVPLHHHVMHLENREESNNVVDGIHLKDMPLKFAKDIVQLWIEFSKKVEPELKKTLDKKLEEAIKESEKILPQSRIVLGLTKKGGGDGGYYLVL